MPVLGNITAPALSLTAGKLAGRGSTSGTGILESISLSGLTMSGITLIADAIGSKNLKTYYGAIGNGSTDDSTAVQNALDDTANPFIYVPASDYHLGTTELEFKIQGKVLFGPGMRRTYNNPTGWANYRAGQAANFISASATNDVFYIGSNNVCMTGISITQDPATTRTAGSGIQVGKKTPTYKIYEGSDANALSNVTVDNISMKDMWKSTTCGQAWDSKISNVSSYFTKYVGIQMDSPIPFGGYEISNCKMHGIAAGTALAGYLVTQGDYNLWSGLQGFRFVNGAFISVATGQQVSFQKFMDCHMDNVMGGYGIKMAVAGTGICSLNKAIGIDVNTGAAAGSYSIGAGCTDNRLSGVDGVYGSLGTPVNNGTRSRITDCS